MDASTIVAASAVVIAIAALGVSVWEGTATRQHNRLAVRPLLCIDFYNNNDRRLSFRLRNNGLGPAVIDHYTLTLRQSDGSDRVLSRANLAAEFAGLGRISVWTVYHGEVVAPQDEIELLGFSDDANRASVVRALDGLMFSIGYASLYEESFNLVYKFVNGQVAPV